ncbi:MAG: hypothetical protein NTV86_06235 [Planctomycetota bacterium]|nr:hypothetical protein [Planctomycetota bacterium]
MVKKLVAEGNTARAEKILFAEGFPEVTHGCSAIKDKCPAFANMAKAGVATLCITDLDRRPCASGLIRDWFGIPSSSPIVLPPEVVFRVAVREVESWIMADREEWAKYIQIPKASFVVAPDSLLDPKQHLFSVIGRKGRKSFHKEMLPRGTAHVGPRYNEIICEFVAEKWSPQRAAERSPSLLRAINALKKL